MFLWESLWAGTLFGTGQRTCDETIYNKSITCDISEKFALNSFLSVCAI